MEKKKICIATSTRADWGLLQPLAAALRDNPGVELQIIATNMHLLPRYGYTARDIEAAGFTIDRRVEMPDTGDAPIDKAIAMAECLKGTAKALGSLKPDIIVVLGDRYEMLAVASAAAVAGVPIAHIAGGEISEGAIDDNIRHAITKLSAIHFAETEEYRNRIIQLGEYPDRVYDAGSLGVWNITHQPLMDADQLSESLGFEISPYKWILSTYHPVTLDADYGISGCRAMLEAFDACQDYKILLTYPNNDAGSNDIIEMIEDYASRNYDRVKIVKSLRMKRYLSMMRYAYAVVGNSSSGLIEVPSMGVPTVNIGDRQRGRLGAPSVINCGNSTTDILQAIQAALSPEMRQLAQRRVNPYARPDTVPVIATALISVDPANLKHKKFYDIDQ